MVTNHVEIMAKMFEGTMGEEERLLLDSLEPSVTLEIEEEDVLEASWVTKGNKGHKFVHIPTEVK